MATSLKDQLAAARAEIEALQAAAAAPAEAEAAPEIPGEEPATNVIQALNRVKRDLPPIGKGGTAPSTMGGFAFRSIEQITRTIQQLTARHGVVILPHRVKKIVTDSFGTKGGGTAEEIRCVFHWKVYGPGGITDVVDGESIGIGRDNFDKHGGKASTGAYKQFLLQLFSIGDDTFDPDANESGERDPSTIQRTRNTEPDGTVVGSGTPPPPDRGPIDWQGLGWGDGKTPVPLVAKDGSPAAKLRLDAQARHDNEMKSIALEMQSWTPEERKALIERRTAEFGPLPLAKPLVDKWSQMVLEAIRVRDGETPPESTGDPVADAAARLEELTGQPTDHAPQADAGEDGSAICCDCGHPLEDCQCPTDTTNDTAGAGIYTGTTEPDEANPSE